MNNIIEFKPKEKSKPDFKINESAVHNFISSIALDYIFDKYGDMDALCEIEEGSELQGEIVNARLELEQKLTKLWEIDLERELTAQRLESEGISRIEQADRVSEWLDNLHAAMELVEVAA